VRKEQVDSPSLHLLTFPKHGQPIARQPRHQPARRHHQRPAGRLSQCRRRRRPNIAGWIKTLQGAPQLSGITSELQNLHDALSSGSTDTGALAQSLSTLGEHTTQAASSATPDAQDKLRQLGQALSSAAGQLRG
jgi:hypothetical protein